MEGQTSVSILQEPAFSGGDTALIGQRTSGTATELPGRPDKAKVTFRTVAPSGHCDACITVAYYVSARACGEL